MHCSQQELDRSDLPPDETLSVGSGSAFSSRSSTLPRTSNVNYQELFRAYPQEKQRDRKLQRANDFLSNKSFSVRKVLRKILSNDRQKPREARSLDLLTCESNYSPYGSLRTDRDHDSPILVGGGYSTEPVLDANLYLRDLPVINGKQPGLTGLINHGNTCFINSILHCLGNTELFMLYFILDYYKPALDDCVNAKNTLSRKFGTCGELTEQLAEILKAIWTCDYNSEQTSNFKNICSKYCSQYRGNLQHDAQEFLLWLLDKIHSDLNVAKKKKYKNIKSGKTKSDETLAAESLSNYSRCNNSFIYDLFQAQFRSSVECVSCGKVSCTFDPYLCVSLPIPSCDLVHLIVHLTQPLSPTVASASPSVYKRRVVSVEVERDGVMSEARGWLALSGPASAPVAPASLVIVCTNNTGFASWCLDNDHISAVLSLQKADPSIQIHALQAPAEYKKTSPVTAGPRLLLVVASIALNHQGAAPIAAPVVFMHDRSTSLLGLKREILVKTCRRNTEPTSSDGPDWVVSVSDRELDEQLTLSLVCESPVSLLTDSPLLAEDVTAALQCSRTDYEPAHVKLVLHWSQHFFLKHKERLITPEVFDASRKSTEETTEKPVSSESVSLLDCFQLYTKLEELSSDNTWACSGCQSENAASRKKLSLWTLPEVLVIHLKRFRQTLTSRTKVHSLVTYPLDSLDMAPYISSRDLTRAQLAAHKVPHLSAWQRHKQYRLGDKDDTLYDLVAVCNHIGHMTGGHYTAYCKNPLKQQWYEFDDNKIRAMSASDVVCNNAYLLFYQRRSAHQVIKTTDPSDHWVHQLLLNKGCDTNLMHWVHTPSVPHPQAPQDKAATIGTANLSSFIATPTRPRSAGSKRTPLPKCQISPGSGLSVSASSSSSSSAQPSPAIPADASEAPPVTPTVAPLVQDEATLSDSDTEEGTVKTP
jgi:ubiquitin carboxyl-terminal hydrolase 31